MQHRPGRKLQGDEGRPEKAAMLVRSEAVLKGVVQGGWAAARLKAEEGTARACGPPLNALLGSATCAHHRLLVSAKHVARLEEECFCSDFKLRGPVQ